MSALGAFVLAAQFLREPAPPPGVLDCGFAIMAVEMSCQCKRTKLTKRGYRARGCTWGKK